ncbi:DNA damage-binding protein 2-like [Saccoglossus kowalevskii]
MPRRTRGKSLKRLRSCENGADQSESTTPARKYAAVNDERTKICSGASTRKTIPAISVTPLIGNNSHNLVHHIYNTSFGRMSQHTMRKSFCQPFVHILSNAKVYRTASPFDRRVTALEWHPTHPTVLAAASKCGDMILWDYERTDKQEFISGTGKGDAITGLKFNVDDPNTVYTSSVFGKISLQDFTGRQSKILLESDDWSNWYCALDVSFTTGLVTVGDSVGNALLLSREGKVLWNHKLHKQKITHCEFNPQCDWLLVTSSVDKTVKLWDVRMIKGKDSVVHVLNHEKPVNSAYFSPDNNRLLTTDQYSEIRVYHSPDWSRVMKTILHPHRFFQHITAFKATWHPMCDLIVVGRYPDEKFPGYIPNETRSIDVIDVNTGDIVCQIKDSKAPGLISLNKFSHGGDVLASSMGVNILIWHKNVDIERKQQAMMEEMRLSGVKPNEVTESQNRRRPQQRSTRIDAAMKSKIAAKLRKQ